MASHEESWGGSVTEARPPPSLVFPCFTERNSQEVFIAYSLFFPTQYIYNTSAHLHVVGTSGPAKPTFNPCSGLAIWVGHQMELLQFILLLFTTMYREMAALSLGSSSMCKTPKGEKTKTTS